MPYENLTIEQMNNMSAEDFDKLGNNLDSLVNAEPESASDNEEEEDTANNQQDQEEEQQQQEGNESDNNDDDSEQEQEEEQHEEEVENDPNEVSKTATEKGSDSNTQKEKQTKKEVKQEAKTEVPVEQAQDFFSQVTSEFKANGQVYKIDNPADVVSLMQKGLNYNQKMNTIKPYMNAGRLLEEHGLLDNEEQLSFLLALHNKEPEAIAKLVQESGIDSFELNEEKASEYKHTPVTMQPDNVVRLRELVTLNKDDADFVAVYQDANSWDEASQKIMVANPEIFETLTEHKRTGVYDKVMAQVNHAVNVQGSKTPITQLYYDIGTKMMESGKNNNAQAQQQQQATIHASQKVTKRTDPNLVAKRKAISSVKSSTTKTTGKAKMTEEQMFSLSPEEFAKINPEDLKHLTV